MGLLYILIVKFVPMHICALDITYYIFLLPVNYCMLVSTTLSDSNVKLMYLCCLPLPPKNGESCVVFSLCFAFIPYCDMAVILPWKRPINKQKKKVNFNTILKYI